ncbi:MAG: histone-like nucleoid-structuring protein Lsr2, partial [Pseudonocardiaceae bacterium]
TRLSKLRTRPRLLGYERRFASTLAGSPTHACGEGRASIAIGRCNGMAKRTVVTVIDDIDGSEGAETVSFGLDGVNYEIDLAEVNAGTLREALRPYVDRGLRVSGRTRGSRPD